MVRVTDPTSRMLAPASLLQTHRYWPGVDLSDRLEVSPRTLRRDIDRLRELGYAVDATAGWPVATSSGRLGSSHRCCSTTTRRSPSRSGCARGPPARSPASRRPRSRALTKLERVMPARLRRRMDALATVAVPLAVAPRAGPIEPEMLTVLAQACRDTQPPALRVPRRDGESATHRRSSPPPRLGRAPVVPRRLRPAPADWRTFRLDRLEAPRTSGARFRRASCPHTTRPRSCASPCARSRRATRRT